MLAAALAAAVVAAAGALAWRFGLAPQSVPRPPEVAQPAPAAPAPGTPTEEVRETPDSESALEQMLPRRSVGHAAGLHRTPDPLDLGASAALVMEPAGGKVVYAKNENAVLPMASVTKLMTGMVLVDQKLPLDEPITITEDDMDRERNSRSRLRVGSVLTRGDALRLALMSSENRAAHALARTAPGGVNAFVAAMNRKAKSLGMNSTTYADPTGLSNRNQSTARDLAALVVAASAYPLLREYSTTHDYRMAFGNRVLLYRNSDPLVRAGWDVQLQKTGYIVEAGHCVVLRTRIAERDLVMVLLDAGSARERVADARRIRAWLGGGPDPQMVAARAERAAKKREQQAALAAKKEKSAKAEKQAQARQDKAGKQAKDGKADGRTAGGKGETRVAKTFDGKPDAKQAQAKSAGKESERPTREARRRGDQDGSS